MPSARKPGSGIEAKQECPVVQVSWDDAVAVMVAWAGFGGRPRRWKMGVSQRGGLKKKKLVWGMRMSFSPDGKMMANTHQGQFPVKDLAAGRLSGRKPVHAFPANKPWPVRHGGECVAVDGGCVRGVAGAQPCVLCAGSSRRVKWDIAGGQRCGGWLAEGLFCAVISIAKGTGPAPGGARRWTRGRRHVGFRCAMSI